jgi:WD40 repeat protein/transcriptional regulator with XRE-family HTH domain
MRKSFLWYENVKRERLQRDWSQAELASRVGSDTKTVRRWERGLNQPNASYRQRLLDLFGKNAIEMGWVKDHSLEDWGEAPALVQMYGREGELAKARAWLEDEHCRFLTVLGIGGIGKTAFVRTLAAQLKYEVVFWYSLRNAPTLGELLEACLIFLFGQKHMDIPPTQTEKISLLIDCFCERRCLFVLDNAETLLQTDSSSGHYLPDYEGYGYFLRRLGESDHQSCLVLTSREKPLEVVALAGDGPASPVRVLSLASLGLMESQQLLHEKRLQGSVSAWGAFVHLYSGNPLALKLVSQSIGTLFGGDIDSFLQEQEEEAIFGDLSTILAQQFCRLSLHEQEVMYWLAIEREPVTLRQISQNMLSPLPRRVFLEVLDALHRRSLLEAHADGLFTLQSVIMEYVTEHLVEQFTQEILSQNIRLFASHALIKAQAPDYLRQSQLRFFLLPLLKRLNAGNGATDGIELLHSLLAVLQQQYRGKPGYAVGNLLNLLVHLHSDLTGRDFSHQEVRQAYLTGVRLPGVSFVQSNLATSVFADTFSSLLCLAISPNGELLAAGTTTGEVFVWSARTLTPRFTCTGHLDGIRQVVFSPDGRLLASSSEDETVRLWDAQTGQHLHVLRGHSRMVRAVAFRSDSCLLASGSEDRTMRLWDTRTGECLRVLEGRGQIYTLAFSPVDDFLASGSDDDTLALWESATGQCLRFWPVLSQPRSLAFQPGGVLLASGHEDGAVHFWDIQTGRSLWALKGHVQRVRALAFTNDGRQFASGSDDTTIRIWNVMQRNCLRVLQGHTNRVWSLVFLPANPILISTSDDDTLRYWQTVNGQSLRCEQGYSNLIKSIAFRFDGRRIVSGSEDQRVRLWDLSTGKCLRVLSGHTARVRAVDYHMGGALIASASEDETVRLWDAMSGQCLRTLRGHTHLVRAVAFSPSGNLLASGGSDKTARLWDMHSGLCLHVLPHQSLVWDVAFNRDGSLLASSEDEQIISLWSVATGQLLRVLPGHSHKIWSVAFSPVGTLLASASDDQTVRLWESTTGECLSVLQGHTEWVRCVAFSPDGSMLISGSHDQTARLWDVQSGKCLAVLSGHSSRIWSVAFNPTGGSVASASDDGTIKCWDLASGNCIQTLHSERLYEGTDITDARGLTDAQRSSLKLLGAIEAPVQENLPD